MGKIKNVFHRPQLLLAHLVENKGIAHLFSDEMYIKTLFRLRMGYPLDLSNPQSFNEKLNYLKLYDRNPLYHQLADKYLVKDFVKESVGEEYVVPCYGVWDTFDDIDFEQLPNQFVLKTTHDSSGVTICKDKSEFDTLLNRKKLDKDIKTNHFITAREWVYKNIQPRIIADKYLDDHTGVTLRDYKFWCFNGIPHYMYCTIKGDGLYENFFDMDFKPVGINHGFPRHQPEFEKPAGFELMKELCCKLLSKITVPFVRIDFFSVENHVYFGEFTFYDWGGMRPFADRKQDYELGKLIELKR